MIMCCAMLVEMVSSSSSRQVRAEHVWTRSTRMCTIVPARFQVIPNDFGSADRRYARLRFDRCHPGSPGAPQIGSRGTRLRSTNITGRALRFNPTFGPGSGRLGCPITISWYFVTCKASFVTDSVHTGCSDGYRFRS